MRIKLFLGLLLILAFELPAQITRIFPENGLPGREISCALQSREGFMWFGTANGLCRFDGYNFKTYTDADGLSNNGITTLLEDFEGMLWIGTRQGINVMDPATGKINQLESKTGSGVNCLSMDKEGVVWVGFTDGEIRVFDKQGNRTVFRYTDAIRYYIHGITAIHPLKDKQAWVLVNGFNLFRINASERKELPNPGGNSDRLREIEAFPGSDSLAIIADGYKGLVLFNMKNGTVAKSPFFDLLNRQDSVLEVIMLNNKNELWAAYESKKVIKIDLKTEKVYDYSQILEPYLSESIRFFYQDRGGIMWIGTGNGIIKFSPGSGLFENHLHIPKHRLKKNSIRKVIEDEKGDIYIGSYSGLFRLNPKSGETKRFEFTHPYTGETKKSYSPYGLLNDTTGYIWIGSELGGFYRFNKNTELFELPLYQQEKTPNYCHVVYDLCEDAEGTIWMGTQAGIRIYDKKQNSLSKPHFSPKLLEESVVLNLIKDQNNVIWAGTSQNGLFRISSEGIQHLTKKDGLPENAVTALHIDRNTNLWIGTRGGGICRMNSAGKVIECYSKKNGLADDIIASITEDDKGVLWIGTFNGLSRLDVETGQITNYYEKDGLSDNEFNIASFLKTRNGKIYLGGTNGINSFFPAEIKKYQKTGPTLYLTEFMVYDGKRDSLKNRYTSLSGSKEIRLFPGDKFFSVSFSLSDYYNPNGNIFSYILEGYDSEWNNIGTQNTIRFNSLPAGNYVLRIKGTNSEGIKSSNELVYAVSVSQAFYTTAWFYLLLLALTIVGVYFATRYRIYQQLKLQRLRTKISSDLHDEVGSLLTRISVQTQLIKSGIGDHNNKEELEKIAHTSRLATAAMSDVIWSFDARNDTMKDLIDRLREHAGESLNPLDTEISFNVFNIDPEKEIDNMIRQNLFLIFKESINNIAKHASASEVIVIIENSGNEFRMQICDNGKGRAEKPNTGGQGLNNMVMRAARIDAQLEIKTINGYTISLKRKRFC